VTDYARLSLDALKLKAADLKIKGRSKMNKAELIAAIEATQPLKAESVVDAIVAGIRNDREARSNKGRSAGNASPKTKKMHPDTKAVQYRLSRGSMTAKLTPKQSKRVRKAEAKFYNAQRYNVCTGMGANNFTYA